MYLLEIIKNASFFQHMSRHSSWPWKNFDIGTDWLR